VATLNRVFLMGNLTRDPEVRYVPSGTAVADLRMAVNRKYRTQSGEERDETCFVNIVVWGKQAEACGQYLAKGSSLLVEGRLQYDEWEKDGQKNNRLRVVADRVQFTGAPRKGTAPAPSAPEEPGVREESPSPAGEDSKAQPAGDAADDDNLPF
jgi:single-strand DNA-binding protein